MLGLTVTVAALTVASTRPDMCSTVEPTLPAAQGAVVGDHTGGVGGLRVVDAAGLVGDGEHAEGDDGGAGDLPLVAGAEVTVTQRCDDHATMNPTAATWNLRASAVNITRQLDIHFLPIRSHPLLAGEGLQLVGALSATATVATTAPTTPSLIAVFAANRLALLGMSGSFGGWG
jgi:hypothetical protein